MFRTLNLILSILVLTLFELYLAAGTMPSLHEEIGTEEQAPYIEQAEESPMDKTIQHLLDNRFSDLFQAGISVHDHSSNKGKNPLRISYNSTFQKTFPKQSDKKLRKSSGFHKSHKTAYYIYILEHIII